MTRGRLALTAAGMAAMAMLLVASVASASKGVTNYFGNPSTAAATIGGQFSTSPGGVATNNANGNIYVVDRTNHRIEQFDSSGNFIRTWGQDVIVTGRPNDKGTNNFEICDVTAAVPDQASDCKAGITTSATGGAMSTPQGIAVNQATGNVYVTDQGFLRVDVFDANGNFLRAFGQDVVSSGPGNVTVASAKQAVTVSATGGTFTLTQGGQTTVPLNWNDPTATVQSALTALSSIGAGNVAVTGLPGEYTIAFQGALANTPEPLLVADSSNLIGGAAAVSSVTAGASGFEVCEAANSDVCKTGTSVSTGGGFLSTFTGYPAIAPASAPNAGDVIVADPGNRRVQEFTAAGSFVRAFGFDVVNAGPDNAGSTGFEVCVAAKGDSCKVAAATGAGVGQFATSQPLRVAEDSTGAIYTDETLVNFRVQKFTPSGLTLTPSVFAPAILSGATTSAPVDIAVDATNNNLYVAKITPVGGGTPPATVQERRVLQLDSTGSLLDTHMAGAAINVLNGLAFNPTNGQIDISSTTSAPRVYVLNNVVAPTATIDPTSAWQASLIGRSVKFTGSVNSNGGVSTSFHFEYSKDGSTWTVAEPDLDIGNGSGSVPVSQTATGLEANQEYKVRLVAKKSFGGPVVTTPQQTFTTATLPPEVTTLPADERLAGSAELVASVNPNNTATEVHFVYGTTASYGLTTPSETVTGGSPIEVTQVVKDLMPETTYHFRAIATNSLGVSGGADSTFTTGSTLLPDNRSYEMVTPVFKAAGNVGPNAVSDDGDRLVYVGTSGFEDPLSQNVVVNKYLAERTPDGWVTTPLGLPASQFESDDKISNPYDASPDLSRFLYIPKLNDHNHQEVVLREANGELVQASPVWEQPENAILPPPELAGSDENLDHRVIHGMRSLMAGDTTPENKATVYIATGKGAAATMEIVNNDGSGNMIGPDCGTGFGGWNNTVQGSTFNALSRDGRTIFFTAQPGTGSCSVASTRPREIYARVDGGPPTQVSASQCVRTAASPHGVCSATKDSKTFAGASGDGKRVYFTTKQQLTDSDFDTTADLYEYNFAPPAGQPNLVQVSVGDSAAGQLQGVTRIADDGGRVYFVAKGVLTSQPNGQGQTATANALNLYVYSRDEAHPTGTVAYVTSLGASDSGLWSATDQRPAEAIGTGGEKLLFQSAAQLTPDDTDSAIDVYLYDAAAGTLRRISVGGGWSNGNESAYDATIIAPEITTRGSLALARIESRNSSLDGSEVFFVTTERLAPGDPDHAPDVYEWRGGVVSRISHGQGVSGETAYRISPSGSDVFFATILPLSAWDTDTGPDLYDARAGGGLPEPPSVAEPCAGNDGCHGPASASPVVASPGSSVFAGPGNPAVPARKKKTTKKKKHHRHQRHHKKLHHAGHTTRKHR